jgi:hypothetical protein
MQSAKAVRTIRGKLLLGWMPREEAMKTLLKLCVFSSPINEQQAEELWAEYRSRVAALSPRKCELPANAKMSLAEKIQAKKLMNDIRRKGGKNARRVLKIDPMRLVVHQYRIFLDHAEAYRAAMINEREKTRLCLGFGLETDFTRVRSEAGAVIIELPHPEFGCKRHPNGQIEIQEAARFISVADLDDRILLWAGYHRTYAVASQTSPDATERVLLVTLIDGDADRFLAPDSDRREVRDTVLGERPAIFADFFDDALCMTVNLRRQRPEWHVPTDGPEAKLYWADE